MRIALVLTCALALAPALALAEPRTEAPTTVTVPVVLNANEAAALQAWCAMVGARENRVVRPQEQVRTLFLEKLAEIEQLTLRAEAARQADAAVRAKAEGASSTTRAYWRRVRATAAQALEQQKKQEARP